MSLVSGRGLLVTVSVRAKKVDLSFELLSALPFGEVRPNFHVGARRFVVLSDFKSARCMTQKSAFR